VHGPDPARFFAECGRVIRPGGRLVICDDVRRPASGAEARCAIERFTAGWHINSLVDRETLQRLAADAGFTPVLTLDLSGWLELGRPRDRAIEAFADWFGWLPWHRTRLGHLIGGHALQTCLRNGWVGYELAVFER
jgi:SAM-dependent methyltransferase